MRQRKQKTDKAAYSILTVDDDPIMTATIQSYFQRSGYEVDVENDPNRAIERIREGSYDILLLDFLMTPICGDQVVAQVRQFDQDIFIILLTGHKSMAPPIKTIRALDIQGYYEKSDRFDQLELLVESCAKSIRQMRTIRSYKDGLSTIMDCLPHIHTLRSLDAITDSILQACHSFLPCVCVTLALTDTAVGQGPDDGFVISSMGEELLTLPDDEVRQLLDEVRHRSSLVRGKQVILPLLDAAQAQLGLLILDLKEHPRYGQIQLLEVFARQVSSAIGNTILHVLLQTKNDELDTAYRQLQDGYLEVIDTLRRVVDAKDTYTKGHSDRVSYYAEAIARHMGRDESYCEQLRIAGLFHDVGKLGIPDEILLKNSKLTDEEYEVIKTHSRRGTDILSSMSSFQAILPAVLSHHERYDGRGYPEGLKGEEIPEMARIIAVADSFDAMTSDRQYRKSLGLDFAMAEIERGRGAQFDAAIADVFLSLAREPSFWSTMEHETEHNSLCQVFSHADRSI